MSDRNARPEWRAAYLNRTVTRRTLRDVVGAQSAPSDMNAKTASSRTPRSAGTHRGIARATPQPARGAKPASLALPIAAMLRLLPST